MTAQVSVVCRSCAGLRVLIRVPIYDFTPSESNIRACPWALRSDVRELLRITAAEALEWSDTTSRAL